MRWDVSECLQPCRPVGWTSRRCSATTPDSPAHTLRRSRRRRPRTSHARSTHSSTRRPHPCTTPSTRQHQPSHPTRPPLFDSPRLSLARRPSHPTPSPHPRPISLPNIVPCPPRHSPSLTPTPPPTQYTPDTLPTHFPSSLTLPVQTLPTLQQQPLPPPFTRHQSNAPPSWAWRLSFTLPPRSDEGSARDPLPAPPAKVPPTESVIENQRDHSMSP